MLLCLGVFSVGVNAKSVDVPEYSITEYFSYTWGDWQDSAMFPFKPRNGITEKYVFQGIAHTQTGNRVINMNKTYEIYPDDGSVPLIGNDGVTTLTIKNTWAEFLVYETAGACIGGYDPDNVRVLLFYNDGTMEYVDDVNRDTFHTYSATFTPKKSVQHIELIFTVSYDFIGDGTDFYVQSGMGEWHAVDIEIVCDQESEETGLLKGIIEWLRGIRDKLVTGFENLSTGIENLIGHLANLPYNLWIEIENGIQNLFVPDETFITEYKDKFDELLSEKYGAVYQVVNLTFNSFDRIQDSDETNTINFPKTTIKLPENNSFSFGGVNVPIIPSGFETIVDILKLIVGIVCTVLFVNGLRKRYDEVMGVEK